MEKLLMAYEAVSERDDSALEKPRESDESEALE